MKATAIAPTDIAFVKYWGRKDEILRLPTNASIAMVLDSNLTTTTVEFDEKYEEDFIMINKEHLFDEVDRVVKHLDRIRQMAGIKMKAKVVSENNFPTSTGLSSSASGFAALTLAGTKAAGLDLDLKELSILSRQGSGSSCRTVINGGFVEWMDANDTESSYAVQIFPSNHWPLVDVVAVVSKDRKRIPTSEGQTYAQTSPFFETRMSYIKNKVEICKGILAEKNFQKLGEFIELEAMELHSIMLTSTPILMYWTPESLKIMQAVQIWRDSENIEAYFTVNTGQDVHIICEEKTVEKVLGKLKEMEVVRDIRVNRVGDGAQISEKHLF